MPSEWSQDEADRKQAFFWWYKNCASNPCSVFPPYFFWTSSGISSLTWHWTSFTGMFLTIQRMCNKNVLSQAQNAACHFRDWFWVQILQGSRLLKPLGWQSPWAGFFPQTTDFTLLKHFRIVASGFLLLPETWCLCPVPLHRPLTWPWAASQPLAHNSCPRNGTWELHSQAPSWISAALQIQKEAAPQGRELTNAHSEPRGWSSSTPAVPNTAKHRL